MTDAVLTQAPAARPSGWWGMALFVGTEATLFATLVGTYLYLRSQAVAWPPPGVPEPDALWPLVLTGALVATTVPLRRSLGAAREDRVARARLGLVVALVVQAGYLAAQLVLFAHDLDRFSPDGSAYASIYFTLLGAHAAHVAAGILLEIWVLARLMSGLTRYRLDRAAGHRLLLGLRQRAGRGRGRGAALAAAMRRPGPETLQWIGLLAAPLAWAVQLVAGFGASVAACSAGGRDVSLVPWELALTAAAAAVAVVGQAAAVLAWRATQRADSAPVSRMHFFADAALLGNTLFLAMILLGGITAAHLAPCRQA